MYLKSIKLENFRNYELQDIEFIKGINMFIGNNAQGKTNIIESIYLCALGKSYRTTKDSELINIKKEFARVNLNYVKNNQNFKIDIFIDKNNRKIIKKDDIKIKKIADHVGEIPFIIFSPDSLDIVKGAPSKRRNFIDMMASQISKSYLLKLQEYLKCLKLKNQILKSNNIDKEYIKILHEKMADYIFFIVDFRKKLISKLLEKSIIIQKKLTNDSENINLIYETDFLNKNREEILNILNSHIEIEIMRKSSVKGIQRDDLIIYINDYEVAKFGSQGQNRTALLTLKLANFELLKEIKNEEPILLLDDIMSELDENRVNFLLEYIKDYQSIITTTEFKNDNVKSIKVLKVENGKLI